MKRLKAVVLSLILIIATLAPAAVVSAAPKSAANTKIDPKLAVPPMFSASQYAILNPVTAIQCGFNIQKMYNYYVQTGVYEGQRIFATPVPMPIEKVFQYMARNRKYYIEHAKEDNFVYLDLPNYILQNMDLYPVLGADTDMWLYHYVNFGAYEGRSCGSTIDPVKVILWNPAIAELNNPGLAPDKIMSNFTAIAEKFDTETLQAILNKDGVATSATDSSKTASTASTASSTTTAKTKHSVKWSLDNVKTNNSDDSVEDEDSFKATLTAKDGYTIDNDSVQIKMGSKNITEDAYTPSTGKINVSKVTADLRITAKGVAKQPDVYSVTWNVNPVNTITTSSGSMDKSKPRLSSWKEKISPIDGYTISSVQITMGGTPIDVYDSHTRYFSIDSVTGIISINIQTEPIPTECSITRDLEYVETTGTVSSVTSGKKYSEKLSASTGYELDSVKIEMGGKDVTSSCWFEGTETVSISSVTGDIKITANAVKINSVDYSGLGSHIKTPTVTKVKTGGSYTVTLSTDTGYKIDDSSVVVKMGENTLTDAYKKETHKIIISNVTGDITITANATLETFKVTITKDHATTDPETVSDINYDDPLPEITVSTTDPGYTKLTVSVTMGGVDITSTAYDEEAGKINIPHVTGVVVIDVRGEAESTP